MSTITEIKNLIKFLEKEQSRYDKLRLEHFNLTRSYYQGKHDACQGFINILNNVINKGK